MASYENKDMSLVEEMDLEVFDIDAALLRELLEEDQEGNDDKGHGNMAASIEENINVHPDMMDREQEQQQQQNCLENYECHDFEWLNMMEPTNPVNDVRMNWFSDDFVELLDFGYSNEECYSQICDGLVSNEATYGCLLEDYDI